MNFTSLQGHIAATYQELVDVFGEPTYLDPSEDGKVNTEWELTGFDMFGDRMPVTIYDWKEYDGGERSRSGLKYEWHIGGTKREAVNFVMEKLSCQ